MSFAERLRAARREAGLSQAEVAGDSYSLSYISHLEAGRREPTRQVTEHIERALGLPPGALGDEGSGVAREGVSASLGGDLADLAALASRAAGAWRRGSLSLARQDAEHGLQLAADRNRSELWWQFGSIEVEVEIDLAHYDAALKLAQALAEHPWVRASSVLSTESSLMASKAARLAGSRPEALKHAKHALDLTTHLDAGDSVRAQALIAALASGIDPSADIEAELHRALDETDDTWVAGLAAWALGNMAFHDGRPGDGLSLHQRAERLISPAADFRNWARFCRSSADERIAAGIETGVESLLLKARLGLEALGNPEELASLTVTESAFEVQRGRLDAALELLTGLSESDGLSPRTQGEVALEKAGVLRNLGDTSSAVAHALRAARLMTQAGLTDEAMAAWTMVDALQET